MHTAQQLPDEEPIDPQILVTINEACQRLRIGRSTLYELIASGDVPAVKIGSRRLLPVAGLRAYVARLAAEQPAS